MIQKDCLLLFVLICFCPACQKSPEPEIGTAQESGLPMPQIKKIPIKQRAEADSLIKLGIDVIVIEDNYVAARLTQADVLTVQTLNLNTEPIQEEELVQRLARIVIQAREDVHELAALGIDIWEVKADTVIAQVYDKHILQAESKGYVVEIIARNVLDLVKNKTKK